MTLLAILGFVALGFLALIVLWAGPAVWAELRYHRYRERWKFEHPEPAGMNEWHERD